MRFIVAAAVAGGSYEDYPAERDFFLEECPFRGFVFAITCKEPGSARLVSIQKNPS